MQSSWRWSVVFVIGLSVFAVGYGLYGLTIGEVEARPAELWVCLAFGSVFALGGLSVLRNAKLTIDGSRLSFFAIGVPCRTEAVELSEIVRWGVGREKGSGGGMHDILLLELRDGRTRSIKIEMYERRSELVDSLREWLGSDPASTRTGIAGARLSEDGGEK